MSLISRFTSVADGQNHDLFPVVVVQGDVCCMSELDHPLAKLWRELFDRASNLRVLPERFHTLPNRFYGPLRGLPALGRQKLMKAGYIEQGRL